MVNIGNSSPVLVCFDAFQQTTITTTYMTTITIPIANIIITSITALLQSL